MLFLPAIRSFLLFLPALCLALLLISACNDTVTAPEGVPASHTVRHGGAFHAPGLQSPAANCASCHGNDLTGGVNGEPSCFSCHGRKWAAAPLQGH